MRLLISGLIKKGESMDFEGGARGIMRLETDEKLSTLALKIRSDQCYDWRLLCTNHSIQESSLLSQKARSEM